MLYHTTFVVDADKVNEWLACLWQGPAPKNLKVREWLTLAGEPRIAVLLWEGDEEAYAFVERAYAGFGRIETRIATPSSGMASAIARDLAGYERMMVERKADPTEIARQVDLRRRGMDAPDQESAKAAARAWAAGAAHN